MSCVACGEGKGQKKSGLNIKTYLATDSTIFTKINHFLEHKRGLHAIIIEGLGKNVGLWFRHPLSDARSENSSFRCQVNLEPRVIFK